jgi:CBS domain containing-hemolysin-like protein
MDFLLDVFQLIGILALAALNGFFVATEFAIVKVRSTQIESLIRKGHARAGVAHQIITHLDAYLSATQLGITLASLALGWVGEPLVARLLHPLFGWLGMTDPGFIEPISFGIAFAVITFVHIVVGELIPKQVAIQRPQMVTLIVAGAMHGFYLFFRPFIWLLNASANFMIRLIGFDPTTESELAHSEEELRLLLSRGKEFSSTGKSILLNAIDFRHRTVREVMSPRTGILFLSMEKSLQENVALALENQFTRYPLAERDIDNVIGMIHLKDLVKLRGAEGGGNRLLEIKREILFVPETMSLERLLTLFLSRRILMAIAVDEYGGTAGLITLENVMEELVGEIRDEFDVETSPVQKISDQEFVVDGAMPLDDFARMFEIKLEPTEVITLSGYALNALGRVPDKGAQFRIGRWQATVESVEARRIKSIRMKKGG